MRLSVIIVNWNVRDLVAQCLESVQREFSAQPDLAMECLVVDNASTDGSRELLRRAYPWVQPLCNSVNVGFAAANNQAIIQSRSDYVLLLNPDTRLQPGALATLLDFLDNHPRVGAVGPQLLNPDGTFQPACYPAPTLLREFWRLAHLDNIFPYGAYRSERWARNVPRTVDIVQGTCLLIRRPVLNQIGLLDEDYYIYTEEVDLCRRIRLAGWTIAWVPTACVVHYGGQSTRQAAVEMFLRLYASKILYFRKQHGPISASLYKWILRLISLLRVIGCTLVAMAMPSRRRHCQEITANYRRLLDAISQM